MMQSIVSMDPFRCKVWQLHDRLEDHITEESCSDEIASFSRHGQLVPVLGRPLKNDGLHSVELIYGARRLFTARHLKKPLLVELREMTDREAIVAMDIENRQRKDISPYERGLSYARWLRCGHFESQDDIARALRVSSSQVSRLLKLAKLPSVIIGAFDSALDIREGWGLTLADILADPERRQIAIRVARTIAERSPRTPALEVYRTLLGSSAHGRKPRDLVHDRVVKGRDGSPLFRVRQQHRSIALLLPVERTSARMLEAIQRAVAQVLQDTTLQEMAPPSLISARADSTTCQKRVDAATHTAAV
jgi:ParB family transcriptional regulator, chromosome partitioning protein